MPKEQLEPQQGDLTLEEQTKFQKLIKSSHTSLPDILGHLSASIIAYFFFTYELHNEDVYIWIAFILATFFLRMGVYWLLHNHLNLSLKQWENTLIALSSISAAAWASLIFLTPNDPVYILSTTLLFVACMGGALGAIGNNFSVYISFTAPFSIILIARLTILDHGLFYSSALTIISYFIAAAYISYKFTQSTQEEALLKMKNEKLMHQLKNKKNAAERANADKSRFLASASHDLRQPLQAMNLFAEALKQDIHDNNQQKLLSKLRESMHAMSNLLNSLLDISKLDAGLVHVNTSNFYLLPILCSLEKNFNLQRNNKSIQLSIVSDVFKEDGAKAHIHTSGVIIQSDPILFENILCNLFSNAVKYTISGEITIGCIQTHNGYSIYIQDTGIGIEASEQVKVFDAFYQIHNDERDRSKGIGLGLSIVKHLCKLLHHQLTMSSQYGQGTRFDIHVPAATEVSITKSPISVQKHLHATILVVDDDYAILEGMKAMMTPWGCHVLTAQSMQDVKKLLHKPTTVDMLLVDYRLRDRQVGTTVIQETRNILNNNDLPAIIISGDTEPQRMQDMERQGFEVLHKPIKPAQLRALMNQLIRKK